MFHNKTLGAAIALALSLGVNSTEATGTMQLCLSPSTTPQAATTFAPTSNTQCQTLSSGLSYAYEQFSPTTAVSLAYPFRVRYSSDKLIGDQLDFYVNFTLSNGVTWSQGLTSANLFIINNDGTSSGIITTAPVQSGQITDSVASFLVRSTTSPNSPTKGITTNQSIIFDFQVANAQKALALAGGSITLTAELRAVSAAANPTAGTLLDTAATMQIATSAQGAQILFTKAPEPAPYISVEQDSKQFAGNNKKSTTQVYYGTLQFSPMGTVLDVGNTGAPTVLGGSPTVWKVANDGGMKGTLTVDNGNFIASGDPSAGNVYLDIGASGAAVGSGSTNLIIATYFSPEKTTARWDLTATNLQALLSANTTPSPIVLNVNGSTPINENRKTAPRGTLAVTYTSGGKDTNGGTLSWLKKNGSVCTLYNIPDSSEGQDVLNIRITNDASSTPSPAVVKGTLRGMDGKTIFSAKTLVAAGNLKPHQTVRLVMADLTAGGDSWKQRAILTLESNIPSPNMQVYGLLRNKGNKVGFPESPLMNMSTGATGNGCD